MTMQLLSEREINAMLSASRRRAVVAGCWIGAFLALAVCAAVGIGLDLWRVANHERLMREATASVEARLSECKDIVTRIDDYERVVAVKRQIDMAREGR